MGWMHGAVVALAVMAITVGCGTDDSAGCLSNDVGKVCAEGDGGSIEFSGSGLAPGSEVLIDHPDLGASVYRVGDDGGLEPRGRGVVSLIADTPFTFRVTATDGDGQPLGGEIIVRS